MNGFALMHLNPILKNKSTDIYSAFQYVQIRAFLLVFGFS